MTPMEPVWRSGRTLKWLERRIVMSLLDKIDYDTFGKNQMENEGGVAMTRSVETLNQADLKEQLKSLPKWTQKNSELVRSIEFPSYLDGLEFADLLGREAE